MPFKGYKDEKVCAREVIALSATKGSKYSSLNVFYESDEIHLSKRKLEMKALSCFWRGEMSLGSWMWMVKFLSYAFSAIGIQILWKSLRKQWNRYWHSITMLRAMFLYERLEEMFPIQRYVP